MTSEILNRFKHATDIFTDVITNDAEYSEAVRNHLIVKENLKPLLEPNEEFRYIAGFPNYVITSLGRVINIKTLRVLKPRKQNNFGTKRNRGKYCRYHIALCNNGTIKDYNIHTLVANAFLTKPAGEDLVINHKNHDTSDNRVENLEWISRSANAGDKINNRWTSYTLDELINFRKKCGVGSNEYHALSKAIQRKRKKELNNGKTDI